MVLDLKYYLTYRDIFKDSQPYSKRGKLIFQCNIVSLICRHYDKRLAHSNSLKSVWRSDRKTSRSSVADDKKFLVDIKEHRQIVSYDYFVIDGNETRNNLG